MMNRWLARLWDEVRPELEQLGIEFVVQETKPRGRAQALRAARVVRVRADHAACTAPPLSLEEDSSGPWKAFAATCTGEGSAERGTAAFKLEIVLAREVAKPEA